jgi:hypothetical protein
MVLKDFKSCTKAGKEEVMKLNKWMLLSIFAVTVICAVKVYAANLSMTTYYPAPTGYYDSIKVNKTLVLPCFNAAPSPLSSGQIWIQDISCAAPTP